jgi:hypothetical protein
VCDAPRESIIGRREALSLHRSGPSLTLPAVLRGPGTPLVAPQQRRSLIVIHSSSARCTVVPAVAPRSRCRRRPRRAPSTTGLAQFAAEGCTPLGRPRQSTRERDVVRTVGVSGTKAAALLGVAPPFSPRGPSQKPWKRLHDLRLKREVFGSGSPAREFPVGTKGRRSPEHLGGISRRARIMHRMHIGSDRHVN